MSGFPRESVAGMEKTRIHTAPVLPRTVILLIILLSCCPLSHIACGETPPDGSPPGPDEEESGAIRWGPYITGTTSDKTIIHVWTRSPIPAILEYSMGSSNRGSSAHEHIILSGAENIHHVFPLENLESGTVYQYRVITGGRTYGDFSFRTYPRSGPISFVVYGDTRDELPRISQEDRHRPVAASIAREPGIVLVIHTGDLVHDGGNATDWDRFFATGAVMLANTTFIPVMGNHEENSSLFHEIFRSPPNYTVTAGDTRIAVLDSNDWAWNDLPSQSKWLRESLSEDYSSKFIALHHPLYSSDEKHPGGYENLRNEWESLFRKYSVTAVFQGHVHLYERDVAYGITYITEARGGAPWYSLAEKKIPEYRMSSEQTLGYSVIRQESGTPFVHLIVKAVYPGDEQEDEKVRVIEDILLPPPETIKRTSHPDHPRGVQIPVWLTTRLTYFLSALEGNGNTSFSICDPLTCRITLFTMAAPSTIPDKGPGDSR